MKFRKLPPADAAEPRYRWSFPEYFYAGVSLIVCIAAYSLSLGGPLFFDDIPNIVDNKLLKITGTTFDEWRTAVLSSSSGALKRPVAMFTFALNFVVSGEFTPLTIKLTNLIIHVGSAGLVFVLAQLILRSPAVREMRLPDKNLRMIALLAAGLWLLHPLNVSTVMYAVQRMAQLSALFTLAGLVVFLVYRSRWAVQQTSAQECATVIFWVVLLGLLGLLSKENGVLLPFLILVVEATLFQGMWNGKLRSNLVRVSWIVLLLPVLAVILLGIIAPETILDRYQTRDFTLEERLLTQARVLWSYVGWIVVPNVTSMGFFHDDVVLSAGLFEPISTLLSILAWICVLSLAWFLRRRLPLLAFAVYFFLVGHSLESTILPLEMVFEHRNYLPSVAICLLVAVGLFKGVEKVEAVNFAVAGLVLSLLFSGLLAVRTHAWRDDFSLARFNVTNHPDSPRANFNYANALYNRYLKAGGTLSDDAEKALVVSARQYFARMHDLAPQDFAGLVMLHQLDSRYFPGLARENDWLAQMEEHAATRRLQRSDRTALGALVTYAISPRGVSERDRIDALLAGLQNRYPTNSALVALRFRLLQSYGAERAEQLREVLQFSMQASPHSRKVAAYLAQYYGSNELPKAYAALATWLANDSARLEVATIREAFE